MEEKKTKATKIAETCTLIHGLDFGGYNSELYGILRKLKVAPVDVTSNKGHVDFCAWLVPRNFHDTVYLVRAFWWLALASATVGRPTVNCVQMSSWRQWREDQHSCLSLYTVAPRQSREIRHSVSHTRHRGPTFDLSTFKTDILFWLIRHIIQNRRCTEHWPYFSMYSLSHKNAITEKQA